MSNIYEQRFFSALKDTFIGHPIKGKSGYVNLMDIKAQYFAEIEPYIKDEINKQIEVKYREELFEKLYHFFDCYLNETGTVFFANSQIHKNLYEKVYSDRDDVSLFWKTQKLYYVKSEANYQDLQSEVNGIKILFDASEIQHTKGNEKKAIQFYMVEASKKEVTFKIRYQENNQYDRLKEYLELDKNNDLVDKCIEEYGTALHPSLVFVETGIDREVIERKTDSRKCLLIENVDDLINTVKIEYSINDISLMLQYLHKKGVILIEEDLKKIFSIYKRQNEIDYFIHKDAEGFLKEQLDIYVYNWLFNDLETDFDAPTVKRMQNIKKIAHKVIEYIARFEDELKAIWEKPKFVRNCNYVLTLDKLADNVELIEKIIASPGWERQVEEWKELFKEWTEVKEGVSKREWNEFSFTNNEGFEKNIIVDNVFNNEFQYVPLDTKYFPDLKHHILSVFNNLDKECDGTIIKTDNWQGLNTTKDKFSKSVQTIYIDPPFNKEGEADYLYKVNYKDSVWLNLLENRLLKARGFLKDTGNVFTRCDHNGNMYLRLLLDDILGKESFINEIKVQRGRNEAGSNNKMETVSETLFLYALNNEGVNKYKVKRSVADIQWTGFLMAGDRKPPERVFLNKTLYPRKGQHYSLIQPKVDKLLDEKFLRIKHRKTGALYYKAKDTNELNRYMKLRNNRFKFYDINEETDYHGIEDLSLIDNYGNDNNFIVQYLGSPEKFISNNWMDISGYTNTTGFKTENAEVLIHRAIKVGSGSTGIIMDFFLGSGTTIAVAHKMEKKWIGFEQGDQFHSVILPRMKRVLSGHNNEVSKAEKFKGGGFFKYYELEQYEDVLAKAQYQWQGKDGKNQVEQYSFMQDQKLLDAIEIDYANKNAKIVFEKLYPDVDIAETLSNLSGKHIKQLFEDKVVFEDGTEIIYSEMTFEEYPWIKPLIWWNSK